MRIVKQLLAAVTTGLVAMTVSATPANPELGKDYYLLEHPRPVSAKDKVEVIEFMWYNCPHCGSFEPAITSWVKKQGEKIAFAQVPVAFNEQFVPQQKLFYTLEEMGKAEEFNAKVFNAIHVERRRVDTDRSILAFAEKSGLDTKKFTELYKSYAIQMKARRATQMQKDYKVDGVPMVVIGGKYVTSPAVVGSQLQNQPQSMQLAATLQVMDHLVKLAAADLKPAKQAKPAKK